jgi:hypothetical protein
LNTLSTRNINVSRYDDEYALFGKALPYIAMLIGAGLVFALAFITRVGVWYQVEYSAGVAYDSSRTLTWIIVISCVVLCPIAWVLFKKRQQFHPFIAIHAVVTVILCHAWLIMAVWQDMGNWMFGSPTLYAYFYGGAVLGVSWCIRRWAYREVVDEGGEGNNTADLFDTIGLGKARGPERTVGLRLSLAIRSSWTWTTQRLLRMLRRNSQK